MGRSIYFTKEEIEYMRDVFSFLDAFEDEAEEKLNENISEKLDRKMNGEVSHD